MDPFATLGLTARFELDPAELESRYRELQKALHPDKHAGAPASQRRMTLLKAVEVNEAYRTLRDDLKRAEALLVVHGAAALGREREAADPELLMEVMELREALGEAKARRDLAEVKQLAAKVNGLRAAARAELARGFAALPAPATAAPPAQLQPLAASLSRLKYYQRFLDEVSAIEEEAEAS
jgi:molecular chaperone HscB